MEQLVALDPAAQEEGGALRRLWIQDQETNLAAATGSRPSRYPNPLVGVPCFQQRDSAQRSQRDRSCFSSSCAMLLEAIRPGTLPGSNGDDAYLALVQRYGDTTDANAQLQALAHYCVTARLVQDDVGSGNLTPRAMATLGFHESRMTRLKNSSSSCSSFSFLDRI